MRKRTFYWKCFKLAGKGVWGVIGDIGTFLALATAAFWHFFPGLLNDPATIAKVNDWGGIYLVLLPLATLSVIRLCLAPYWIYQESEMANLKLREKVIKLKHNPVAVKWVKPVDRGVLTARIINQGDHNEPIQSVYLFLSRGRERLENFKRIREIKGLPQLPGIMGRRSNFDVVFPIGTGALSSWGVSTACVLVVLQDERETRSELLVIQRPEFESFDPEEFFPKVEGLTLAEGYDRHERITKFVRNYKQIRAATLNHSAYRMCRLVNVSSAGILDFWDNDEARDAFKILNAEHIDHPFDAGELTGDYKGFFQTATNQSINLRGSDGASLFASYFPHLSTDTPATPEQAMGQQTPEEPETGHPSTPQ